MCVHDHDPTMADPTMAGVYDPAMRVVPRGRQPARMRAARGGPAQAVAAVFAVFGMFYYALLCFTMFCYVLLCSE